MKELIFEQGDLRKSYLRLALPIVLSMIVTIIYNIADTFFVSITQNAALVAGVSVCTPVFTILQAFGNMYGLGGGSLISRLLGQKETERIRKVSSFGFYTAIITGLLIGVILLLFRQPLVYLLGADSGIFSYALEYFTVMAAGGPFLVLGFIHMNYVRCEGMTKESMFGTVLGAVINIILDPVLIVGLSMGARGAALATVIGYICSDLYFIRLVKKKCPEFSMNIRDCTITKRECGQIIGIGMSSALVNLLQSVCMIMTNQYLLRYGSDNIAAMGIALKISLIASLVLVGFSFGGQPMLGYFYGAGDKLRLKQLIRFATIFLAGTAFVLSAILIVLAPWLVDRFLHNPAIVEMGTRMLRWQLYALTGTAVFLSISVVFQSLGKITGALILSVSRQGFIYLAVVILAVRIAGLSGIIMSQAIADVIALVLALVLYYRLVHKEL